MLTPLRRVDDPNQEALPQREQQQRHGAALHPHEQQRQQRQQRDERGADAQRALRQPHRLAEAARPRPLPPRPRGRERQRRPALPVLPRLQHQQQ